MESSGVDERAGIPALSSDGSNLPAVLDSVLRRDRKRFEQIVAAVAERIQGLEDIKILTPAAAHGRIEFVIERGLTIPGSAASTGVRTVVFFVTLAFLPTPPKQILIEEPETGVHPKRLEDIVGLLRDVTEGKHGERSQVVLTTHSPYLLDHIDLERDQVLVFRRRKDGSRAPVAADREGLRKFLDEFMLGEIWYNRGEEGLLTAKG
jgi:predicted ATPase